jgi:hypothetical protein
MILLFFIFFGLLYVAKMTRVVLCPLISPFPDLKARYFLGAKAVSTMALSHYVPITIGEIASDRNHDLYMSYHMYV